MRIAAAVLTVLATPALAHETGADHLPHEMVGLAIVVGLALAIYAYRKG